MEKHIGNRIRERRIELGLTQPQLGEAVGKTKGTVSQWESGLTRPKGETLIQVADKLRVSERWLLYGDSENAAYPKYTDLPRQGENLSVQENRPVYVWDAPEDLPDGEYVIVPRVDVKLSAGTGELVFHEELKDQGNAYRIGWVRQHHLDPKKLITATVKGASMSPTLPDGASVTIDTRHNEVDDGKVYAIGYGDEVKIKRLYKRFDGSLILRSDNPDKTAHPDEIIQGDDLQFIRIIGRYVAHMYDGDI
ncbi:S24 family peptidase [Kushneria phosphatilytica]|uniref:Helix-turn-helix transcriptional regulator n=1 Tax=Kushneria phosphatilytica TaxID=657387 RepID=A0A1S1NYL5_9GAMM|nr:helix-turn-helix transcriptional regulator [Kushneria phosphatilytica]OHV12977.1 hypothetical protein BH688_02960 [Kushneria phosphatilytica]QEL10847.1 helix-turn-helix transcriptional regulator [Kushneria phosphatilytica]